MPAHAQITCLSKIPPQINVKPSKSHVKYDFTKTKAQLNSVDVDTISPYGPHHKTNVSGLMSGSIQLKNRVSFIYETYDRAKLGCVYLKAVDVEIHVEPTVFIAKEFPEGGCMHSAILAHEFKHVREDQLIVNKYINVIGRKISGIIDQYGSTYGPMKKRRMAERQEDMKNIVHRAIIDMNDDMNIERQRRQQAIDSLEEYESIGFQCKSRNKPRRR